MQEMQIKIEGRNLLEEFKKFVIKILVIVGILLFNLIALFNGVYAASLNSVDLYTIEESEPLLTYKGETVLIHYIEYQNNGIKYPAYCIKNNS